MLTSHDRFKVYLQFLFCQPFPVSQSKLLSRADAAVQATQLVCDYWEAQQPWHDPRGFGLDGVDGATGQDNAADYDEAGQ